MRYLLLVLCLIATAASADPLTVYNSVPVQGFAPNGLYTELLTVNSKTINLNTACNGGRCLAISTYAPADYIIRLTATASKTGSVSDVGIGGVYSTIIYNKNTPFAHISSATNGRVRKM